jgi:uncharacterized protein YkwD
MLRVALALLIIVSGLWLINDHRVIHGCDPLTRASDTLVASAQEHSREMAQAGYIFHSTLRAGHWSMVGEVVGVGGSVLEVIQALFNSPEHRRILLDCRYDKIAIGIYQDTRVWFTGRLYAK